MVYFGVVGYLLINVQLFCGIIDDFECQNCKLYKCLGLEDGEGKRNDFRLRMMELY